MSNRISSWSGVHKIRFYPVKRVRVSVIMCKNRGNVKLLRNLSTIIQTRKTIVRTSFRSNVYCIQRAFVNRIYDVRAFKPVAVQTIYDFRFKELRCRNWNTSFVDEGLYGHVSLCHEFQVHVSNPHGSVENVKRTNMLTARSVVNVLYMFTAHDPSVLNRKSGLCALS